jgi:hypothetical protein
MPIELDPRAKENQELYRRWRDARKDWEDEARKDVDFFLGNHFTAGESSDLSSRNQADIPMDRVAPAVEKFKSMLTAKPPVFTVIPREDSDSQVSQIWRTILGYVWDVSDGDAQMKQAIHDYTVTGLGYLYAYVDNNADFGRGDVKFTYVNPFRVYVPPDCRDRWFTDADGIILSTILTGEQVVNLYPQLGDQVDPETGEMIPGLIHDLSTVLEEDYPESTLQNSIRAFTPAETKDKNWWGQEKYQILERFYPITVPFYRVVDSQTGQESIMDEEAFSVLLEENPGAFERGFLEFEEIQQPRVAVSASLGEVVLYEKVLNIDMYPIVPVPNIWTETPYPKSDVSRARPMQRLLNKLWSLALSHAQASAGLKLIVPMGSVPNIEDLERDWSNPNAVIEVDTTQGEPHYPAPQPLAGEFYRLIQQCEFYIDFSFGVPEMMHGVPDKAPETVRGTERMIALGSERPKSKLRDIEFSINRLGRVLYGLAKGHYTYKKVFTLAQPNNDEPGISVNLYDDVGNAVNDIYKDRLNIGQHDVRIQPGSTLPESKWAIYDVYLQAFQLGLVDRMEVLAKNPEIFDKAGIMQRLNDYDRYEAQIQGLQGQVQELEGDLQTARRESVHDRMRVEVSKLKSKLSDISSRGEADRKVKSAKMDTAVKLGERDIKDAVKSIGGD